MNYSITEKNWLKIKLGDLAFRITKGGTPTTYGFNFQKSGINFIKVENVDKGQIILNTITDFVSKEAHDYQNKSKLEEKDILFSIAGTIGETCVVKKKYLPANTNQALAIIRGTSKFILPNLLNYQLEAFVAKIKSKARGGAMNNVSLEDLKNLYVILPSQQEQKRLLFKLEELLSSLDKGIESLKTAQQELKIYRQAVLKYAFEGKLTNKNVNGELPEGWKTLKLGSVTEKVERVKLKEQNPEKEFIYLDIGCIDNKLNKVIEHKTYKWKDAPSRAQQIIINEDILFSTVRTYLRNIAFVDKPIYNNNICSSGFTVIRAKLDHVLPKYLFYNSIYDGFIQPLNELQTGTSYPAVRDEDVFNQFVNIPNTLIEQKRIVQEIESRLSVCDKIEESIKQGLAQAEALRQSILKKAFEGKLVPQDPNDEPASKLLERILEEKIKSSKKK
jgi:type I restriction enzyme S subunit